MANVHKRRLSKGLRPLSEIAEELGISLRCVSYDYRHAMNKLRNVPGAFELILANIHAIDASTHDPIQCSSVECNRMFCELFADKEDDRGKYERKKA
jgi:hypothetical protein